MNDKGEHRQVVLEHGDEVAAPNVEAAPLKGERADQLEPLEVFPLG